MRNLKLSYDWRWKGIDRKKRSRWFLTDTYPGGELKTARLNAPQTYAQMEVIAAQVAPEAEFKMERSDQADYCLMVSMAIGQSPKVRAKIALALTEEWNRLEAIKR